MREVVTLTSDVAECPSCGSPLVHIAGMQRQCNCCGLVANVVTPEDALEAEQMKKVPAQERGKQYQVGRYQTQW